jgi:hypothetical protein
MAYDEKAKVVVLFGGGGLNDTWVWNGKAWSQLHPTSAPPGRIAASMAYDAVTEQIVLFGGINTNGLPMNDTWTWDGTNWTQQHPTISPPARAEASMAYDASRQRIVLFGGEIIGSGHATSTVNDTWTWDGTNWAQQHPTVSPPARAQASMAYDVSHQQVLLFGGFGISGLANDTWTWDGSVWSEQQPAVVPPARSRASMVYDAVMKQVVLFAGAANFLNGELSDTWLWNGTVWTHYPTQKSPRGLYTVAAYDEMHRVIVAYVVYIAKKLVINGGTWLWDGKTWTLHE